MDEEKKQIDKLLSKAAAEKVGLGPFFEEVEKLKPFIEKVGAMRETLRGEDGKTPELGVDYLTEEQQQAALEMVRPVKGRDYNDGAPGKDGATPVRGVDYLTDGEMADIIATATPKKGTDYFTPEEVTVFKNQVTPKKGVDYFDGKNPTPAEFIEVVKNLKGADAASFSQVVGSKIDISHVRNAGSFIFNGKKYETHELMHGGGGSSGSSLTLQTNGVENPDQTLLNLVEGANVTITDDGAGNITIAATGDTGVASVTGTANRITISGTAEDPIIDIASNYVGQNTITTLGTVTTGTWSATTIAVNKGGTGQTSYTDGQLLIGNSVGNTLSKATLTQGSGITITNGNGTITISAAGGGGVVETVVGTLNRISVDSTDPANPVVDIDAAYVGQSSITTLGTIGTGVWNATTIGVSKGGTGVTTIAAKSIWLANSADTITSVTPGAGQSIRINAGNTAWEAYTPAAGTVTSVSGTSNRITSTGGATPVIDIAATYVGQSSITTLGTIATGVWNGTVVAGQYGGTGVANTGKTITVSGNTTLGSNTDTLAFVTGGNTSITLPTTGTVATLAGSETLTNKVLSGNTAVTLISGSGTLTLNTSGTITIPSATDTLVGKATTDTFTNKTLTNSNNTLGGVTMTLGSDATGDIYYRNSGGQLNRLGVGSDGDQLQLSSGLPSWVTPAGGGGPPTGSVMMYIAASAPTGYLLCDASAVSRATYSALFAIIGTTYGSGDGSTTFNVPDFRGRVPIGVGTGTGGGTSGTGTPTGGAALTAVALATWKGEQTHTMTTGELASHNHDVTFFTGGGGPQVGIGGSSGVGNQGTSSTGSNTPFNVIQPVMGINFIIKT